MIFNHSPRGSRDSCRRFVSGLLFLASFLFGNFSTAAPPDSDAPKDAGDITGRLLGCGAAPVTAALVYAPATSFDARTDATGQFRISYVQEGTYDLVVRQGGTTVGTVTQVMVLRRQTTDIGSVTFCSDRDGDGFMPPVDCDDNNPNINPAAEEQCGDGIDNNCDGVVDEACVVCTDIDGDGFFGQPNCGTPVDCNDGESAINPLASEVCDDVDNDCDGDIDEPGALGSQTWYPDFDGDGFGDSGSGVLACSPPGGFVGQGGDCEDANPAVNPSAVELCDGIDNDCDGTTDEDLNQDTFNGQLVCNGNGGFTLQCNAGFGNCDGDPANGCESDILSDASNCGLCGFVCPPFGDQDLGVCNGGICQ